MTLWRSAVICYDHRPSSIKRLDLHHESIPNRKTHTHEIFIIAHNAGSKIRRRQNLSDTLFLYTGNRDAIAYFQPGNFIIFSHCVTSPMAQHNQIAVACSASNILWRRMHRKMLQFLLKLIINLIGEEDTPGIIIPLQDVVDVLWDILDILWTLSRWQVSDFRQPLSQQARPGGDSRRECFMTT